MNSPDEIRTLHDAELWLSRDHACSRCGGQGKVRRMEWQHYDLVKRGYPSPHMAQREDGTIAPFEYDGMYDDEGTLHPPRMDEWSRCASCAGEGRRSHSIDLAGATACCRVFARVIAELQQELIELRGRARP